MGSLFLPGSPCLLSLSFLQFARSLKFLYFTSTFLLSLLAPSFLLVLLVHSWSKQLKNVHSWDYTGFCVLLAFHAMERYKGPQRGHLLSTVCYTYKRKAHWEKSEQMSIWALTVYSFICSFNSLLITALCFLGSISTHFKGFLRGHDLNNSVNWIMEHLSSRELKVLLGRSSAKIFLSA